MSRKKGFIAEKQASQYLQQKGFHIIHTNFYSQFGEIDIIASYKDILHFIEVKSSLDYETAIANITPNKIRKIIRTSEVYIKKYQIQTNYQYDAIIITPKTITLIENITI